MEQLLYFTSGLGTWDANICRHSLCLLEVHSALKTGKKPTNVLKWTITFKVFSYFSLHFQ